MKTLKEQLEDAKQLVIHLRAELRKVPSQRMRKREEQIRKREQKAERNRIIIQLHSEGKTDSELAKYFNIHIETLRDWRRGLGLECNRMSYDAKNLPRKIALTDITPMISFYLEGRTLQETGDKFGLSRERIRQILNENGVKPRKSPITISKRKTFKPTASERFWNSVDIKSEDECWEWQRTHNYPTTAPSISLRLRGFDHNVPTYRAAYYFTHGKPPKGLWLFAVCRNRFCCNPKHIVPKTPKEVCALRKPKQNKTRGL